MTTNESYYPSFDEMRQRLEGRGVRVGECLIWDGSMGKLHVQVQVGGRAGRKMLVHRMAFELHHQRRIAEGMVINHLCGNGHCFEVEHLEEVTQAENALYRKGANSSSATGYRGVQRVARAAGDKFQARLKVRGRITMGPLRPTAEQADLDARQLRREAGVKEFDATRYAHAACREFDGIQVNNTTGQRGVYKCSATGHYRARVCLNGKMRSFGTYPTIFQAAIAAAQGRAELGVQ